MIPSGLQALMEASAVLQQQASQTAPGPQGQQPTVANQVMQQAQQAAQPMQMPQMQAIGKQAGIAGQLMAQRQQQQQQAAQNPEAIAQMAAQMLQQKGVAALPTNMQFREGGIIGYAGPEGSVVTNPVPDREGPNFQETFYDRVRREVQELREGERPELSPDVQSYLNRQQRSDDTGLSMAERANQQLLRQGSIYASPAERAKTAARYAQNPYSSSAPMANPEVRDMYAGLGEQQKAIRAYERPGLAQLIETDRPIKSAVPAIVEGAARAVRSVGEAVLGPQPDETAYNRELRLKNLEALTDTEGSPLPVDRREEEALRGMPLAQGQKPVVAPAAPPKPDQPSAGIAAALPPASPAALSVTKPDYQKILAETPESPESIARRQEKDKLRRERLGIAQAQEDLSARGIEALSRAKKDREQLLESARSRDTYERLNALFTSMRTLGNEVGNTQRAIQAREEAIVSANLLHEESVLKLKQAQQARQLGLKDQEIQLIEAAEADEKKAQELRRADAKIKAELAKSAYEVDTREMTHARDRANATALKLAELKQQAQKAEDDRETRRLIGLQARLTSAQDSLTRAKNQVAQQIKATPEYKAIQPLEQMKALGNKLTPEQQRQLDDFNDKRERAEASTLQRFYAQLDAISKELGLDSPAQTGTIKFDSSGKRIQ